MGRGLQTQYLDSVGKSKNTAFPNSDGAGRMYWRTIKSPTYFYPMGRTCGLFTLSISNKFMDDNAAFAWGDNTNGPLGDNTEDDKSIPVSVLTAQKFVMLTGGYRCSAGITADGTCWTWGDNHFGQLGDNTTDPKSIPTSVATAQRFIQVAGGGGIGTYDNSRFLAITADGTCWGWGNNDYGALGDNTTDPKSIPTSVATAQRFVQVAAGNYHSLGITSDGTCWAWGFNGSGQLGIDVTTRRSTPVSVNTVQRFIQIACNAGSTSDDGHSLAITSDGICWAWGLSSYGQLGDNTKNNKSTPISVNTAQRFIQVGSGEYFSAGITSEGICWTWGENSNGQLGDNTIVDKSTPISVNTAQRFVQISVNRYCVYAYKSNGEIWAWGRNASGQLGDGTTVSKSIPIQIAKLFK